MAVFVPVPSIRQAKAAFVPPQGGLLAQGPAIDYALCVLWADYRLPARPAAAAGVRIDWAKARKTAISVTTTELQTPRLLPQRLPPQLPPPPPRAAAEYTRPAFDVDAISSRLED